MEHTISQIPSCNVGEVTGQLGKSPFSFESVCSCCFDSAIVQMYSIKLFSWVYLLNIWIVFVSVKDDINLHSRITFNIKFRVLCLSFTYATSKL